jgi:hypothetical protein
VTTAQQLEAAREWIRLHAQHDESNGPCYGLVHARTVGVPDSDDCHTCKCGLDDLKRILGVLT